MAQTVEYTPDELMAVVISREVRDCETVGVGAVSPIPAAGCILAEQLHAPHITLIILDSVQPGFSVEDVRQNTGFDLRVSPAVHMTSPPTAPELHLLRTVVREKLARSYPDFVREKILGERR